ncbi:MAG: acetate--CoA ligase, partial [Candidatus Bathyarchaeia archaeon]
MTGETRHDSAPQFRVPPEFEAMRRRAVENPEGVWSDIAGELAWFRRWDRVFEWSKPFFKWFTGGLTNISYGCLDRHVREQHRGGETAIIWESAETGQRRVLTYGQLLAEVERFASVLETLGVRRGDRVTLYMPMLPEAAVAMLACARRGIIHSAVFGGFGAGALADRVRDADSKLIVTADVGYRRGKPVKLKETVDEALKTLPEVGKVIVFRRGDVEPPMMEGRDIYWEEALKRADSSSVEVERMEANETAFILHTSGTMAKPKGTVHTHGGYAVYIYAMGKWVYDMRPGDVWWSTSDIGWIVGHSYVVYGPLLAGCTTIMFEGIPDYPTPDVCWDIIERNRITKLWTSPTAVRTLMKYGNEWTTRHDLSSVRVVFCAGEVLNPAAWNWLHNTVLEGRIPVIDHMWQTESAGPMVGNPYGVAMLPVKPGSAGVPLPGVDADVVDDNGKPLPAGVKGNFVCRRPFPGLTPTLWCDADRYAEAYWNKIPGYYYTGDAALKDEDGYLWFIGRSDEVLKIAAHRIGTFEVENCLVTHPAVAEAAVVGRPDPVKGEVAVALIALKTGASSSVELEDELRAIVRRTLGPIVLVEEILIVPNLPKTRSGKIMRRLIKAVLTGQPLGDYSTLEDEASVDE